MTAPVRPKFKVDEDLPVEVAILLQTAGYDATTVFAQRMHGWADDRL